MYAYHEEADQNKTPTQGVTERGSKEILRHLNWLVHAKIPICSRRTKKVVDFLCLLQILP